MTTLTVEDRFLAKVDKSGDCWIWTAHINKPTGYGRFRFQGDSRLAHRISYELFVGPIPEGLTIDHLCRVRSCVNPMHLEPVTQQVNIQRAAAVNYDKDFCRHGHPRSPENTVVWPCRPGFVACKPCHREIQRRVTQSRRERENAASQAEATR